MRKGKLLRKGKLKAKDQDEESEVKVTSEPDHVTVDVGESREGMGTSGADKDEGNKWVYCVCLICYAEQPTYVRMYVVCSCDSFLWVLCVQ